MKQIDINPKGYKWAVVTTWVNSGESFLNFFRTRESARKCKTFYKPLSAFESTLCKVHKNKCGTYTFEKSW